MNIEQNKSIFSLDVGTRSIIGTVGVMKNNKFNVIAQEYLEHKERAMLDGQIHDINIVSEEVMEIKNKLENKLNFQLHNVCIAAAGRFLKTSIVKTETDLDYNLEIDSKIVRSLEMTAVKECEDKINKYTKGKLYCVGYSVMNYYLNGYVISNLISHKAENIGVEVIATFLPRSVVDSLYSVMRSAKLNVMSLTLEPIAALEAVVPKEYRLLNIALVDIGAGTSDIAICNNDTISSFGMVPLAGDEVTECIAKNLLTDFNTAEEVKKQIMIKDTIQYKDVLGMQNEVNSEEILKFIDPVVKKITFEVGKKIIQLNGEKPPKAVFLVGGGAYTPNFKECICDILKLPKQRIALKETKDVKNCIYSEDNLKSIGVTVLGIALVSMKKIANSFIDIIVNGKVVSLFNTGKHTIKDVLIQSGINPRLLIGKNGKNIRFTINGIKKMAFGTIAITSNIKINGIESNIDSDVREHDVVKIKFAKDGDNAAPKVCEYLKEIDCTTFYINDNSYTLEPIVIINEKYASINDVIKDEDNIKIIYPKTLGDYKKYFGKDGDFKYFMGEFEINDDYIIKENDIITRENMNEIEDENSVDIEDGINAENIEVNNTNKIKNSKSIEKDNKVIKVIVNSNEIMMTGKNKYIFVDIFDYIKFDLSKTRGNLILKLNDKQAGYYDELSDNDNIIVKWE